MSLNVYRPHVLVLPEDDANRQIVNGFLLASRLQHRLVHVLSPAGGWLRTINALAERYTRGLVTFVDRRMVVLIDFDDDVVRRCQYVESTVPREIAQRVFLLGVRTEPEDLRGQCRRSFESIGLELAGACASGELGLWQHELLRHNQAELDRLMSDVRPFLFA